MKTKIELTKEDQSRIVREVIDHMRQAAATPGMRDTVSRLLEAHARLVERVMDVVS